ncbi:hypothetical protein [Agromyces sp. Root1464]|nr:hypothetical protein [Agromyces sp. Root1464]
MPFTTTFSPAASSPLVFDTDTVGTTGSVAKLTGVYVSNAGTFAPLPA